MIIFFSKDKECEGINIEISYPTRKVNGPPFDHYIFRLQDRLAYDEHFTIFM